MQALTNYGESEIMMQYTNKIIHILLISLLLLFVVTPFKTSAFSDTFSDGDMTDWNIISGSWSANNFYAENTLTSVTQGVTEAEATMNLPSFAYYSVDMKMDGSWTGTWNTGTSTQIFVFQKNSSTERGIQWRCSSYHGGGGGTSTCNTTIDTVTLSSVGFALAPVSLPPTPTGWYRFTMTIANNNIRVDTFNSSTLVDSQTVSFDNIEDSYLISLQGYVQLTQFAVGGTSISLISMWDNIHAYDVNPGTGIVDAPATINLNTISNISYSIYGQDFTNFDYYIDVYDAKGSLTSISTGTITSGFVDYNTVGKTEGIYLVYLVAKKKTTGIKYYLSYDTMFVDSNVAVYGYTRDAITGNIVTNANVNFSQLATWFNTTSDGSGYYSLTGMQSSYPISINASKIGYIHFDYSYTPSYDYNYSLDLFLWNTSYHSGDTGIEGLVLKSPFKNSLGNASINASNSTTYYLLTSAASGYWSQQLADQNDNFNVNASKTGYTSASTSVAITNQSWSQAILTLDPIYNLTILAKDSVTGGYLSTFTVNINDANSTTLTTTTGFLTLTEGQGLYLVTVSATGYFGSAEYILLTANTNKIFTLTPYTAASGTTSTFFATTPHNVKFIVVDDMFQSHKLSNVYVTAQGYNTTIGNWSWLSTLLNVNFAATPINNVSMSGYTGQDGSINFMMIESIYYQLNFTLSGYPNQTWTSYPHDLQYIIPMGTGLPSYQNPDVNSNINTTVSTNIINTTHAYINLSYIDGRNLTLTNIIYLNQTQTAYPFNQTTIQSYNCGTNASCNASFLVQNYGGQSYLINIKATHTTFGTISRSYGVNFPGLQQDLGLDSFFLTIFAISITFFVAAFFGQTSREMGAALVCVITWIFIAMNFYSYIGTAYMISVTTAATIVATFAIIRKRQQVEGVA